MLYEVMVSDINRGETIQQASGESRKNTEIEKGFALFAEWKDENLDILPRIWSSLLN